VGARGMLGHGALHPLGGLTALVRREVELMARCARSRRGERRRAQDGVRGGRLGGPRARRSRECRRDVGSGSRGRHVTGDAANTDRGDRGRCVGARVCLGGVTPAAEGERLDREGASVHRIGVGLRVHRRAPLARDLRVATLARGVLGCRPAGTDGFGRGARHTHDGGVMPGLSTSIREREGRRNGDSEESERRCESPRAGRRRQSSRMTETLTRHR